MEHTFEYYITITTRANGEGFDTPSFTVGVDGTEAAYDACAKPATSPKLSAPPGATSGGARQAKSSPASETRTTPRTTPTSTNASRRTSSRTTSKWGSTPMRVVILGTVKVPFLFLKIIYNIQFASGQR